MKPTTFLAMVVGLLLAASDSAEGQRSRPRRPTRPPIRINTSETERPNYRNEVEGTIWEYKVIPRSSSQASQAKDEADDEAAGDDDAGTPPGGGGRLRQRLAGAQVEPQDQDGQPDENGIIRGKLRIDGNGVYQVSNSYRRAESEHRIGDFVIERKGQFSECEIRFDDHPTLKGRAVWKMKNREEGGVQHGYYVDEHKKRWKWEMRRGED